MQTHVEAWFTPQSLEALLGTPAGKTQEIAQAYLVKGGKRWRPLLALCSYQAFKTGNGEALPAALQPLAVAVECFHKASLIHDDIEDNDDLRYGDKTLHKLWGVPIALNVGDYLLGEGYRMIALCDAPAEARARMLLSAAAGHRCLCTGQGDELVWMRAPAPMGVAQVLDIFRRKTAPAFEVALHLGAIAAGADAEVLRTLSDFSKSLGVAYQVRDDIDDYRQDGNDGHQPMALRPSVLLAIAHEAAAGRDRAFLDDVWRQRPREGWTTDDLRRVYDSLGVLDKAAALLEEHRNQALAHLRDLRSGNLTALQGAIARMLLTIASTPSAR